MHLKFSRENYLFWMKPLLHVRTGCETLTLPKTLEVNLNLIAIAVAYPVGRRTYLSQCVIILVLSECILQTHQRSPN